MEVMIGLEVHCQLDTKSKLFCSDSTDHHGKPPNADTCPICLGFPGSKPKVNKKAIDYAIMIGMALNCKIAERMWFSRKTYFYPDLPKNFQITQYEVPVASDGYLNVGSSRIRIRRVHIEEDPARLVHMGGDITSAEYVLIDYNRSGTPLAEIVTEPDFKNTKDVRAFLQKLASMLEHLGVYDSSEEGSLRIDANVSIEGGERVEVKNISGFENVEKALNYEIVRQNGMRRMEVEVERETRHFDAESRTTKSLRKKETEDEYGYIFEPDLPEIHINGNWMENVRSAMPELPDQRVARFVREYGLTDYSAGVIVYTDKRLADFFEGCCRIYGRPAEVANWTINYLLKSLNWRSERIGASKVREETFVELLQMIDSGEITERYAKELIKEYVDSGESPRKIVGMEGDGGAAPLEEAVAKVAAENRAAVEELRAGKGEVMGFLIGRVLAETGKRGDPKAIREAIMNYLNGPEAGMPR